MMLPAALLITALILGAVWADTCGRHSRQTPVLVTTAEPRVAVFTWPEEEVELRCRPAQAGPCRWVEGSEVLGTDWVKNAAELGRDCRLKTTRRGTITCLRGQQVCGSVEVNNAHIQYVRQKHYGEWWYGGESNWSYKSLTYMCSTTGTIIRQDQLCDGTPDCAGGEDEQNCRLPCGPPYVGPHSSLFAAARDAYPGGSQVTHVCRPGFSFGETLSGLNVTCRNDSWTAPSPVCRRRVPLNHTVAVTGRPLGDCDAAVDGDLSTWCMLAPGAGPQILTVQLADNTIVTTVLVRSLTSRYDVVLRNEDGDELPCPCREADSTHSHPVVSGVRACSCPERETGGRSELLVRAEAGALRSLAVAEVVALEPADADGDECALLGQPAHGWYETTGLTQVRLACGPGYSRSCPDAVQCSEVRSGAVRLSCTAVSCPQPPNIPNTEIASTNGTGWRAVTEYRCSPGFALWPADQTTTSSCDSDGLWTVGHITCLPETDIRVVALRLGEQHARSMAGLRAELLVGQQRLLTKLNSTQHRLAKLERELGLLAEGSYLQPDGAAAAAVSEGLEETTAEPTAEDPVEGEDGGVLGLKTATE